MELLLFFFRCCLILAGLAFIISAVVYGTGKQSSRVGTILVCASGLFWVLIAWMWFEVAQKCLTA